MREVSMVTAREAKIFELLARQENRDPSIRIPNPDEFKSIIGDSGHKLQYEWEWVRQGEKLQIMNVKTFKIRDPVPDARYPFRLIQDPE